MPEMAKVARERSRTAARSSSPAPAPALVPRRTPLATHPDQLRGLSPASRAAAVRNLQARVGNQAVARLLGEGSPPPAAGHPDHSGQLVQRGEDRSSFGEQDADRNSTFVRSQAEPFAHAAEAVPASVADTVRSPGQPLQPTVRQEMASRLGADFAAVRTHTDAAASRSAEGIGARAYTAGSHIVFRAGEYQPSTPAGRQLLAHELTHVIQQRHGPVAGTDTGSGLTISNPSDRFEREAEATASRVMSGPDEEKLEREAAVIATKASQIGPVEQDAMHALCGAASFAVTDHSVPSRIIQRVKEFTAGHSPQPMTDEQWFQSGQSTFGSLMWNSPNALVDLGKVRNVRSVQRGNEHAEDVALRIIDDNIRANTFPPSVDNHLVLNVSKSPCTSTSRGGLPITSNKTVGCTENLINLVNNGRIVNGQTYRFMLAIICRGLYAPTPSLPALDASAAAADALRATGRITVTGDVRLGSAQRRFGVQ